MRQTVLKSVCILWVLFLGLHMQAQNGTFPYADSIRSQTGFAPVPGNRLEILDDGPQMLRRILQDIRGAQSSIELEFYWIRADRSGREVQEALLKKLQEGVSVRIIVDNVTNPFTPVAFYDTLRKAGAGVFVFTDPEKRLWTIIKEVGIRDHRKIAIFDDRICYTGGMNLCDDIYRWDDTQIRLEGPVARDFRRLFEQHWAELGGEPGPSACLPASPAGNVCAQLVPDCGNVLEDMYVAAVNRAQRYFYARSPYFCPPVPIREALKAAARRGVDVRLMVPRKGDWSFMNAITKSYYAELLDAGIQVFEIEHIYDHGKTFSSDDALSCCGTVNLDERSFHINHENCVLFYDSLSAIRFRNQFLELQKDCKRIGPEDCKASCFQIVSRGIVRWFEPVL